MSNKKMKWSQLDQWVRMNTSTLVTMRTKKSREKRKTKGSYKLESHQVKKHYNLTNYHRASYFEGYPFSDEICQNLTNLYNNMLNFWLVFSLNRLKASFIIFFMFIIFIFLYYNFLNTQKADNHHVPSSIMINSSSNYNNFHFI